MPDIKTYAELWILARYLYRIGQPFLSDSQYDEATETLRNSGLVDEYVNRTYDDDPIPYSLLEKYKDHLSNITPVSIDKELYRLLGEDKSQSIRSITTYQDAWDKYFKYMYGIDLIVSLKCDGVYTNSMYKNGDFIGSISRGRNGDPFDWTKGMSKILPLHVNNLPSQFKLISECLYDVNLLEYMRLKYNETFKTPKSTAISFLRVDHDIADYNGLKYYAHGCDGVAVASMSDQFSWLNEQGFSVVPWRVANDCPNSFVKFVPWLREILTEIHEMSKNIFSDGVVVAVNDLSFQGTWTGIYNDRTIALKLEYWSYKAYRGIAKDIILEQQAVDCCCKVLIEPMLTADLCEAKVINVFNPSRLFSENIKVGSPVYFVKNSSAVNINITSEEWDKLMVKGDDNVVEQ